MPFFWGEFGARKFVEIGPPENGACEKNGRAHRVKRCDTPLLPSMHEKTGWDIFEIFANVYKNSAKKFAMRLNF